MIDTEDTPDRIDRPVHHPRFSRRDAPAAREAENPPLRQWFAAASAVDARVSGPCRRFPTHQGSLQQPALGKVPTAVDGVPGSAGYEEGQHESDEQG